MRTILLALALLTGCGPALTKTVAGPQGGDGFNSLITMTPVSVGAEVCASESGVDISSGLDLDRNSILDESEVTQTTILCNGDDGDDGQVVYVDCRPRRHRCRVVGH